MTTSETTSSGADTQPRKHPLAECERCGLYEGKYAPGIGPESATIAIVGEAPGYQEAKDGVPFTGPSGKLLDQVLAHHGINRSDVYVDNACACRPRDNRTPTAIEVSACKPRLLAELDQRPIET